MNQQQELHSTFDANKSSFNGTVSPKYRKSTYQEQTPVGQQNRSSSIASHHRKSDLREHSTEARQRMNQSVICEATSPSMLAKGLAKRHSHIQQESEQPKESQKNRENHSKA